MPFTSLVYGAAHAGPVTEVQRPDGVLCHDCHVDFGFARRGFWNKTLVGQDGKELKVGEQITIYVPNTDDFFRNSS